MIEPADVARAVLLHPAGRLVHVLDVASQVATELVTGGRTGIGRALVIQLPRTGGNGEPVRIESVVVPDPGPGEALVSVQACGMCHTDLHYREGGIGDDFPYLLGHEAAGTVEAVGPDVSAVAPGDFVVSTGAP